MSVAQLMFGLLALATAGSALMVVISNNIVRAAVWLLFSLAGTSGLYFLLGAEFVGAAQLIVYVGGTMVLVVFGVMLTATGPLVRLRSRTRDWLAAATVGVCLFTALTVTTLGAVWPQREFPPNEMLPGVEPLGGALVGVRDATPVARLTSAGSQAGFRTRVSYLFPFEIISVHLLVVLIGAAYLACARRKATVAPSPLAGKGRSGGNP